MAAVGLALYLIGGALPHSRLGNGSPGVGRRWLVFSEGFFVLGRFLLPLALVLLTVLAAVRISRGSHRRFEAGILLGVGGLLLSSFMSEVLVLWLVGGEEVHQLIGGYARLSGPLLVIAAGIRALLPPEPALGGSSAARGALMLVGAGVWAVGHLIPVVVRESGSGDPPVRLDAAWRAVASFRLNDDLVTALVALTIIVLAGLTLVRPASSLTIRGVLFAFGSIQVATAAHLARELSIVVAQEVSAGFYFFLGGGAVMALAAGWPSARPVSASRLDNENGIKT